MLKFHDLKKESGDSLHRSIEETKSIFHLVDLRGLSGMAGRKNIH